MTIASRIFNRALAPYRHAMVRANYCMGRYDDVVWLIGDGRSGTTWASRLINFDGRRRDMFEPFHPDYLSRMRFLRRHEYVRPGASHPELEAAAREVFTGKLVHARVDSQNWRALYRGLIVKDIFANLFARWATRTFANIKPILLVRNPFAVAASKRKNQGWWAPGPAALLEQAALVDDHLRPFENLIERTMARGDFVLEQVLLWSIINWAPLRQFSPDEIYVLSYERLRAQPREELAKVLGYIGSSASRVSDLEEQKIRRPTRVTKKAAGALSAPSDDSWRKELETKQIDRGLEIVQAFGFAIAESGELTLPDDAPKPGLAALPPEAS